jgi:hypothetical protein
MNPSLVWVEGGFPEVAASLVEPKGEVEISS